MTGGLSAGILLFLLQGFKKSTVLSNALLVPLDICVKRPGFFGSALGFFLTSEKLEEPESVPAFLENGLRLGILKPSPAFRPDTAKIAIKPAINVELLREFMNETPRKCISQLPISVVIPQFHSITRSISCFWVKAPARRGASQIRCFAPRSIESLADFEWPRGNHSKATCRDGPE